jgi:hypothetical protein
VEFRCRLGSGKYRLLSFDSFALAAVGVERPRESVSLLAVDEVADALDLGAPIERLFQQQQADDYREYC